MRRPPGETVANKLVFALGILLVPWLVNAQQQPNQVQSLRNNFESPHESINPDALHTLEATRLTQHSPLHGTPLSSERRKRTLDVQNEYQKNNLNDASAIATLAPAIPAVRAPPTRRSSTPSAGLASPQSARSLEDWEVEDFVLLATVDGKLYARDRKTGGHRWSLEMEGPIVETTHHRRNRSALEEDYQPMDDYLWIVEPSNDGRLFIYFRGGKNPGLVNTHLTMKKLVEEMAPYAGEDPPVVYTGYKKTTMMTIDARNGQVINYFGPKGSGVGAGDPNAQSCVRPSGLPDTESDECTTRGKLTLGQTDYIVGIQGRDGHEIATLKYSEWGPNNYDHDLQAQYRKTLDSKYVLSNHDGGIFGYDHSSTSEATPIYKQKFPYPVARVFDVARPWGTESKDPELIVLPQPVPPLDDDNLDSIRNDRIFLNHTEDGSWYAMSGSNYPLVAKGPAPARCQNNDYWRHAPLWEEMNDAQLSKALVGLHSIDTVNQDRFLSISPPPEEILENETIGKSLGDVEARPPSVMERVRSIPSTATTSLLDFVNNPIMTLVMALLFILYYKDLIKWARSIYQPKVQPVLESAVAAEKLLDVPEKDAQELPAVANVDKATELQVSQDGTSTAEIDDVPPLMKVPTISENGVLPPGPESSGETAQPTPKKKKAHRGQRGGVKHRKGRAPSEDSAPGKSTATVEDAVRDAKKLGEETRIEPDVQTLPNGVTEVSGPILRLNSLEVNTEKLIGTGSNGTMVFEGKFDGRDVAVKRMLIQFFDIASQETKLLRESDDHPNGKVTYPQHPIFANWISHSILRAAAKCRISLYCSGAMSSVFSRRYRKAVPA
jgi:serine/threonine-protein kinase/endoribonuclease IRE1